MKRGAVLLAMAVLAWACGAARGDGVVLLPSQALQRIAEQTQLAVVEVKPDRTVGVDLFISLLDESGESHEVPFLLPLQTMPEAFGVQEQTLAEFEERRVEPLKEVLDRGAREDEAWANRAWAACGGGAVLCGPCAVMLVAIPSAIIMPVYNRAGVSGSVLRIEPALSAATEHARAEVYPALKPEEMAALAETAALPAVVAKTLEQYAGRPFALVRLHTSPPPAEVSSGDRVPAEKHPGLCFAFTQGMVEKDGVSRYDYPLGTGQGWEQAIPLSRVYVVAPEDFLLDVGFPPGKWGRRQIAQAAGGRQVHVATWYDENPREDVEIGFRGRGRSSFMIERANRRRLVGVLGVVFPVAGLLAWVALFAAMVWPDEHAKSLGFWRALWRSWLTAQMACFVAVAIAIAMLLVVGAGICVTRDLGSSVMADGGLPVWTILGLLAGAAALIVVAILDYRILAARDRAARGFVWLSAAVAVFAAVVYLGASCAVLLALFGDPFGK